MKIDTEAWTTSSEAARLLGCSPQRVSQMTDDGSLEALRPWPHVVLIERRSIAQWLAGGRQDRINTHDARRHVQEVTGVIELQALDIDQIRDVLIPFITERRPRWNTARGELWATTMANRLFASGSPN